MPKSYFTLAPICAESTFQRYLELPTNPDKELRLLHETNLLFLPFYTDEIPFEFWVGDTQYQDADVLMLMLDPTDSASYAYLMAQLVILRVKRAPVILVEFLPSVAPVAGAGGAVAASSTSLNYRNTPAYQALVAAFDIKSAHRYAINVETASREILKRMLFEGLEPVRTLSSSGIEAASGGGAGGFRVAVSAAAAMGFETMPRTVRRARINDLTSLNLFRLFGATEGHIAEARAPLSPEFRAASTTPSLIEEMMGAINSLARSGLNIEEVMNRSAALGLGMARRLRESGGDFREFMEIGVQAAQRIAEMLGVDTSTHPVEAFVLKPNPINERFEALRNKVAEIKRQLSDKTTTEAVALLAATEKVDNDLESFSMAYSCPISGEIMQHPLRVGSGDGKSIFDKNSLLELLRRAKAEKKNAICPLTRTVLTCGEGENRKWISPPEEAADKRTEILTALCLCEAVMNGINEQLSHLLSTEAASAAASPSPAS